jgi:hypothetical protein
MRLHVLTLLVVAAFFVPAVAQTPIDIQPVKELIPNGTLATSVYMPLDSEAQFFGRLDKKERVNDNAFGHYTIHGKKGKYVSWFGIVRGITPAALPGGEVTLLIQHHFFDGLTDSHIMLIAISGDGDFLAKLTVDPAQIPPLALVRIYGKVTVEKNNVPEVAVEYVRVWPWLTFTFTDLAGEDHSNPRWQKYSRIKPSDRIYRPYPNESYYRTILGDPADFGLNLKPE